MRIYESPKQGNVCSDFCDTGPSITTIKSFNATVTEKEIKTMTTMMNENGTITVTLTTEQVEELDFLRSTGMNNLPSTKDIKTIEQITYQALGRGIAAIKTTRAQYAKTREAVRGYKDSK